MAAYKVFLGTVKAEKYLPIWESQQVFQNQWDVAAPEIGKMYDLSLQNSQTKRLWKREAYEPKRMMLAFMEMQPDFVAYMFKDLFNEEKSIGGRVDRFVFHCDELLQEYKQQFPRSIDNNHYHGDRYQMLSLYLAFRYPDLYTYYDGTTFWKVLGRWGTANLPAADDFERFCKIAKTIYSLLAKDEELLKMHQERLVEGEHYLEKSLLVVYDFYQFCFRRGK